MLLHAILIHDRLKNEGQVFWENLNQTVKKSRILISVFLSK